VVAEVAGGVSLEERDRSRHGRGVDREPRLGLRRAHEAEPRRASLVAVALELRRERLPDRAAQAVAVLLGRDRLVEVALVALVVGARERLVGEPQDGAGGVELAAEAEAELGIAAPAAEVGDDQDVVLAGGRGRDELLQRRALGRARPRGLFVDERWSRLEEPQPADREVDLLVLAIGPVLRALLLGRDADVPAGAEAAQLVR
jgi:hypothetical protein